MLTDKFAIRILTIKQPFKSSPPSGGGAIKGHTERVSTMCPLIAQQKNYEGGCTVMRLVQRLFCQPEHKEKAAKEPSLYRLLAPSVLAVCVSAVCLCGASWAWFTASISTDAIQIQAASYIVDVTATVKSQESAAEGENGTTEDSGATEDSVENGTTNASTVNLQVSKDGDTTVTFPVAGTYTVALGPTGTATSGYCEVQFGDTTYYTENLVSGSESFTVYAAANDKLIVTPKWGEYNSSGKTLLSSTTCLGTPPADSSLPEANAQLQTALTEGDAESQATPTPALVSTADPSTASQSSPEGALSESKTASESQNEGGQESAASGESGNETLKQEDKAAEEAADPDEAASSKTDPTQGTGGGASEERLSSSDQTQQPVTEEQAEEKQTEEQQTGEVAQKDPTEAQGSSNDPSGSETTDDSEKEPEGTSTDTEEGTGAVTE